MKKKILYIVLCLIGLFSFSDVRAKVCTDEDIANARATLGYTRSADVIIPTLNRTGGNNKAHVYWMTLSYSSA